MSFQKAEIARAASAIDCSQSPFREIVDVDRILVPRGRAPFGQHQESRPLASSNNIPVLNGFVNKID